MRLLVTGGAGFIGSNFVRRALEFGEVTEIVVLDSLTYAGRESNLNGVIDAVRLVKGDIRDEALVNALVEDSDVVVNFAAETHNDNSLEHPQVFFETNVLGTLALVQACVSHDVRLHHISTDEVFGDFPLGSKEKFDRESPYKPSSPYSASKASADHIVRAWTRSFGLRATISNCSNNYGPFQHEEKLIPRTILNAVFGMKPKVYGTGLNVRDWIHVDDHNDGILAILNRGQIGQTYLLGAQSERTNLQVVQAILGTLGLPEDFFEFVRDRSGHDLRYGIDATETSNELGWQPIKGKFEAVLPEVVNHYLRRIEQGELTRDNVK